MPEEQFDIECCCGCNISLTCTKCGWDSAKDYAYVTGLVDANLKADAHVCA